MLRTLTHTQKGLGCHTARGPNRPCPYRGTSVPMGMGGTTVSTSLPPPRNVHTHSSKVSLRNAQSQHRTCGAGLGQNTILRRCRRTTRERYTRESGSPYHNGGHLGYDDRRRGHFAYCPKEQRLRTYKVLRWYEDRLEQCKRITADTPVEYRTLDDLQFGQETASLLP